MLHFLTKCWVVLLSHVNRWRRVGYPHTPTPGVQGTTTPIVQSVADLRGAPGTRAPLGVQILSFSCSFRPKKLVSTPNLGVGAPPPGKILDPPLTVSLEQN